MNLGFRAGNLACSALIHAPCGWHVILASFPVDPLDQAVNYCNSGTIQFGLNLLTSSSSHLCLWLELHLS